MFADREARRALHFGFGFRTFWKKKKGWLEACRTGWKIYTGGEKRTVFQKTG